MISKLENLSRREASSYVGDCSAFDIESRRAGLAQATSYIRLLLSERTPGD